MDSRICKLASWSLVRKEDSQEWIDEPRSTQPFYPTIYFPEMTLEYSPQSMSCDHSAASSETGAFEDGALFSKDIAVL